MTEYISIPSPTPELTAAGYAGAGWYFWDETQSYCYGPYGDQIEAEGALEQYARWLDNGGPTP